MFDSTTMGDKQNSLFMLCTQCRLLSLDKVLMLGLLNCWESFMNKLFSINDCKQTTSKLIQSKQCCNIYITTHYGPFLYKCQLFFFLLDEEVEVEYTCICMFTVGLEIIFPDAGLFSYLPSS